MTTEFCYRNPDGTIEVRYRRKVGADSALIKQVEDLQKITGKDCPYFYRKTKVKI